MRLVHDVGHRQLDLVRPEPVGLRPCPPGPGAAPRYSRMAAVCAITHLAVTQDGRRKRRTGLRVAVQHLHQRRHAPAPAPRRRAPHPHSRRRRPPAPAGQIRRAPESTASKTVRTSSVVLSIRPRSLAVRAAGTPTSCNCKPRRQADHLRSIICPRISPAGNLAVWTLTYHLPASKSAACCGVSVARPS